MDIRFCSWWMVRRYVIWIWWRSELYGWWRESKLEIKAQASIIGTLILELEGNAIRSNWGDQRNEIRIFELHNISLVEVLLEFNCLIMDKGAIVLDHKVDGRETSITRSCSNLNYTKRTMSISVFAFLAGAFEMASFCIFQSPFPQTVKGQGITSNEGVWIVFFWMRVKAEVARTRTAKMMSFCCICISTFVIRYIIKGDLISLIDKMTRYFTTSFKIT